MITSCPICYKEAIIQDSLPYTNKDSNSLGYYHYICFDHTNRLTPKPHFSCYANIHNQLTQFYLYDKNLRVRSFLQINPSLGNSLPPFDIGWETAILKEQNNWEPIAQGPEPLSPQEAYQKLLRCHNLLVFL